MTGSETELCEAELARDDRRNDIGCVASDGGLCRQGRKDLEACLLGQLWEEEREDERDGRCSIGPRARHVVRCLGQARRRPTAMSAG